MRFNVFAVVIPALLASVIPAVLAEMSVVAILDFNMKCLSMSAWCSTMMYGKLNVCTPGECTTFLVDAPSAYTTSVAINAGLNLYFSGSGYDSMSDLQFGWDNTRIPMLCTKECFSGPWNVWCSYTCGGTAPIDRLPKSITDQYLTKEQIENDTPMIWE
ncbi:hypothetical protein K7432_011552 [Basidiobolus ranarum]|uniref:Uncharacterized protein n=1 Tax=Basidiobolus ranarum TaxID=34480 RepID=A0ABR2VTQ9_9FUNG